jgi:uroporphyrinogen decarboxylase
MTPKERMGRALSNKEIDHLPTQINYTITSGQLMAEYFKVPLEQLPEVLGNHLQRVDISYDGKLSNDGQVLFDWWGVGFDTNEEGYFAVINPLKEDRDLEKFAWPDPNSSDLLREAEAIITAAGVDFFVVPNIGFALFERAWSLRGFEEFFLDMATDPAYAGALLDRITEIQSTLIQRYIDLGVDGGYFGDDYGAQKSLLFSPRMWRDLIKPRLARLFKPFSEHSLPVMMHSDGQIQKILPDLVEIGLTTLNPVQPEVLNHRWLRNEFGDRLSFYGGVSTQTVLPYGTPEDVGSAVTKVIDDLAPDGTGLVIAPSHRLMSDIPLENIVAMMEAWRRRAN